MLTNATRPATAVAERVFSGHDAEANALLTPKSHNGWELPTG